MAARRGDSGLTLIEMLVVLSILSIAAGVLILRFAPPGSRDPGAEAGQLADRLAVAGEAALVSGTLQALVWTRDSYRIDSYQPGTGWQPVSGDAGQALGSGLSLTSDRGDGPFVIAPGGLAMPAEFRLTSAVGVWRVAFDGLSARVSTDAPAVAVP